MHVPRLLTFLGSSLLKVFQKSCEWNYDCLKKKKYTKIIKFDIHRIPLWALLSKKLFVSLGYARLAGTMSFFSLFKPCHSSCNHASLSSQTTPTFWSHAHFYNNHAHLHSSWVVCHLLRLFVYQFDDTLFSLLNFCKSRTTNLMNTAK